MASFCVDTAISRLWVPAGTLGSLAGPLSLVMLMQIPRAGSTVCRTERRLLGRCIFLWVAVCMCGMKLRSACSCVLCLQVEFLNCTLYYVGGVCATR